MWHIKSLLIILYSQFSATAQTCFTTTPGSYRIAAVQTRPGYRKDQKKKKMSWGEKMVLAGRFRTGAMWLESVSSSSLHQLQYTRSDDAWKSIYATSQEGRQCREKRDAKDGWKDRCWLCMVKANGTAEQVKFPRLCQQFSFESSAVDQLKSSVRIFREVLRCCISPFGVR